MQRSVSDQGGMERKKRDDGDEKGGFTPVGEQGEEDGISYAPRPCQEEVTILKTPHCTHGTPTKVCYQSSTFSGLIFTINTNVWNCDIRTKAE